jgi:Flp pilus assembly protein TadG
MNAATEGDRQRGQMLALFAISLVAIIAMTGLVIDGGMTFTQRRDQQNVADAAAMAGAYAYATAADSSTAVTQALDTAAANGYTHGQDGAIVTTSVSVANGIATVTANVTKPHRNYFSGIVGFGQWDVSVTASAVAGLPNAAMGAMPILFNKKAFPNGNGPTNEVAFDEPGNGNEDVPQNAFQFNWTVYCTASGNACNGNSSDIRDLIDNKGKSTVVNLNDDIGPLNAGAHTTLFSALAGHVGEEFPVSIVNDEGEMQGWAMFHLTGSVGGSTKQIRGYFVSPVNPSALKIVQGAGSGSGNYGATVVRLTN